jgi:hypothetical protein
MVRVEPGRTFDERLFAIHVDRKLHRPHGAGLVPDPDALLSLEVEEISGVLLEHLNASGKTREVNRHNFFIELHVERDKFLATINKPTIQEKVADGLALFSKMVEKYRTAHVEAEVAGRFLLAKPTRDKYVIHLEQRIVPQWGDRCLCEINPDEVQQWLFKTCDSWHMMNDLRGIMSGIYTKAEEWGYWPEGRRNPISRVKIGEKWSVSRTDPNGTGDSEGPGAAERSQPARD